MFTVKCLLIITIHSNHVYRLLFIIITIYSNHVYTDAIITTYSPYVYRLMQLLPLIIIMFTD